MEHCVFSPFVVKCVSLWELYILGPSVFKNLFSYSLFRNNWNLSDIKGSLQELGK